MSEIKDEEAKERATEKTNALALSLTHINTSDRTDVRSSREIEKGWKKEKQRNQKEVAAVLWQ